MDGKNNKVILKTDEEDDDRRIMLYAIRWDILTSLLV